MTIRSPRPEDLPVIQTPLRASGLPADDLAEYLQHFLVACYAERLAGVVAARHLSCSGPTKTQRP